MQFFRVGQGKHCRFWILPIVGFMNYSATPRKGALGLWTSVTLCDFGSAKRDVLVYIKSFPRGLAMESVISRDCVTKCCYTFEGRIFPLESFCLLTFLKLYFMLLWAYWFYTCFSSIYQPKLSTVSLRIHKMFPSMWKKSKYRLIT